MRQSFFSIIIVLLSIVYSIQANQAKSGFWSSLFSKGKTSDSVIASSVEVTSPHHDESSLKAGIAKFYDQSSSIWVSVWGDDLHHGFYPDPSFKDHKAAQRLMIDKSLDFAYHPSHFAKNANTSETIGLQGLGKGFHMVDVGCGVGGSSRYIVGKYAPLTAKATGVSLSPFQVNKANDLSRKVGLGRQLQYQVGDAMKMPFSDNSFDLAWSMESGEHMPEKERFVNELFRVTKPGGRIIIVTWCHRELKPGEKSLAPWEEKLLHKISKAYFLPEWVAPSKYIEIAGKLGLEDIREDDWSDYVAPFWPAVIRSALVPWNFLRLIASGTITFQGAIASFWMREGLRKGVIKFVVITGKKKGSSAILPAKTPKTCAATNKK